MVAIVTIIIFIIIITVSVVVLICIVGIFTFLYQVRKDVEREQMAQALADSLETSMSNQVLELVIFSCHRLCQRLSFPLPVGLVMQSTSRLLVYKTTTQNFLLKLTMLGQP
jgi:hypothetical protein